MKLPFSSWKRTIRSLGFRTNKNPDRQRESAISFQVEPLEQRQMLAGGLPTCPPPPGGGGGGEPTVWITIEPDGPGPVFGNEAVIYEPDDAPSDPFNGDGPTEAFFTVHRSDTTTDLEVPLIQVFTANEGEDYVGPIPLTVSFEADGEAEKTYWISALTDYWQEGPEHIELTVVDGAGYVVDELLETARLTILDDDIFEEPVNPGHPDAHPEVSIFAVKPALEENEEEGLFKVVRRNGDFSSALTVTFKFDDGVESSEGYAIRNVDYTVDDTGLTNLGDGVYSIVIAAGESTAEFVVTPIDDSLDHTDPDESEIEYIRVDLLNAAEYRIVNRTAENPLFDNDGNADPYVFIERDEANFEGRGVTFKVRLSKAINREVMVDWSFAELTAQYPEDFVPEPDSYDRTIIFAPGETTKPLSFTFLEDDHYERPEEFEVWLLNPVNANLAPEGSKRIGTIYDTNEAVCVKVVDDIELNEGESGFFEIEIDRALTGDEILEVSYAFRPMTAIDNVDYETGLPNDSGTVEFSAGSGTTQSVSVIALSDLIDEEAEEFRFQITSVKATHVAGKVHEADRQKIGTIYDTTPTPWLHVNNLELFEGETDYIVAQLSHASSRQLSFIVDSIEESATEPEDYRGIHTILTFAPGQTTARVAVKAYTDLIVEPDEFFIVQFIPFGHIPGSNEPTNGPFDPNDYPIQGGYPGDSYTGSDYNGSLFQGGGLGYLYGKYVSLVKIIDLSPTYEDCVHITAPNTYSMEGDPTEHSGIFFEDIGRFVISRGEEYRTGALEVQFQLTNHGDSATINQDYLLIGAEHIRGSLYRVTIPDGQARVEVIVQPLEDVDPEWDEHVTIRLTPSPDYHIIEDLEATVWLLDNDELGGQVNRNVDFESTGLTREIVGDGKVNVNVADGKYEINLPLPAGLYVTNDNMTSPMLTVYMKVPNGASHVTQSFYIDEQQFGKTVPVIQDGDQAFVINVDLTERKSGHFDYIIQISDSDHHRTIRGSSELFNTLEGFDDEFGEQFRMAGLDKLIPNDGTSLEWTNKGLSAIGGLALMRGDTTSAFYESHKFIPTPLLDSTRTGDWQTSPDGYFYTDESGASAVWTISEPPTNELFQIFVSYVPDFDRGNATYTVAGARAIGNSTELETIVDQKFEPGELSFGPRRWRSLGWFERIADQTPVTVTLTGDEDLIVADKIMVIREQTFITPNGSFNTLEQRQSLHNIDQSAPHQFLLTQKDQSEYVFDHQGRLVAHFDRNDNQTRYFYTDIDGDGFADELEKVVTQGGLTTRLVYAGAYLDKVIEEFASRETDFDIASGRVSRITLQDPDQGQLDENRKHRSVRPEFFFEYLVGGMRVTEKISANKTRSFSVARSSVRGTSYWYETFEGTENVVIVQTPDIWDTQLRRATGKIKVQADSFDEHLEPSIPEIHSRVIYGHFQTDDSLKWTFQTNEYGLVTAMTKPVTNSNPQNDIWLFDRHETGNPGDRRHGLLVIETLPAGGQGKHLGNESNPLHFESLGKIYIQYDYDENGNLIHRKQFEYNQHDDSIDEFWEYGAFNTLIKYTDELDRVVEYIQLDSNGNPTMMIERDSLNNTGKYGTSGQDRSTQLLYTAAPTSISALAGGLVFSTTVAFGTSDAVETITEYFIDENNKAWINLVKSVVTAAFTPVQIVTDYAYDQYRNQVEIETPSPVGDGTSVATTYHYDRLGQLIEMVEPVASTSNGAPTTIYKYDGAGNLISTQDPNEHTTETRYDHRDRVKFALDPPFEYTVGSHEFGNLDVASTHYEYDHLGNVHKVRAPNMAKTIYISDLRNQIEREILPAAFESGHPYGANYNSEVEFPNSTRTILHKYDSIGKPIVETSPQWGNVEWANQAMDNNWFVARGYDFLGRKIVSVSPHTEFHSLVKHFSEYDDAGQLTKTIMPAAQTGDERSITYEYDSFGRVFAETKSANQSDLTFKTSYAFDLRNNTTFVRQPSVIPGTLFAISSTTYDLQDRIDVVTGIDPGFEQDRLIKDYDYNNAGYLARLDAFPEGEMTNSRWTQTTWDELGRISKTVTSSPFQTEEPESTYRYDLNGNRIETKIKYREDDEYEYLQENVSYDASNRVWRVLGYEFEDGNRPDKVTVYDELGNVSYEHILVDPESNYPYQIIEYAYDRLGRLFKAFEIDEELQDTIVTRTVAYDVNSNIDFEIDNLGAFTDYTFDTYGRLTERWIAPLTSEHGFYYPGVPPVPKQSGFTYSYTKDGSLYEEKRITVYENDPDVVTNEQSRVHDAWGNLVLLTQEDGNNVVYSYDVAGNQKTVRNPAFEQTSYTYDNLGRQVTEDVPVEDTDRHYRYNAFGELVDYTNRNGGNVQFAYDNAGKKIHELWSDGYEAYFEYTPLGERSFAANSDDPSQGWISEFNYEFDQARNLDVETRTYRELAQIRDPNSSNNKYESLHFKYESHFADLERSEKIRLFDKSSPSNLVQPVVETEWYFDRFGRIEEVLQEGTAVDDKDVDFRYSGSRHTETDYGTYGLTKFEYYSNGSAKKESHYSAGPNPIWTYDLKYDLFGRENYSLEKKNGTVIKWNHNPPFDRPDAAESLADFGRGFSGSGNWFISPQHYDAEGNLLRQVLTKTLVSEEDEWSSSENLQGFNLGQISGGIYVLKFGQSMVQELLDSAHPIRATVHLVEIEIPPLGPPDFNRVELLDTKEIDKTKPFHDLILDIDKGYSKEWRGGGFWQYEYFPVLSFQEQNGQWQDFELEELGPHELYDASHSTELEWNERNQLARIVEKQLLLDDGGWSEQTTQYDYDVFGNLISSAYETTTPNNPNGVSESNFFVSTNGIRKVTFDSGGDLIGVTMLDDRGRALAVQQVGGTNDNYVPQEFIRILHDRQGSGRFSIREDGTLEKIEFSHGGRIISQTLVEYEELLSFFPGFEYDRFSRMYIMAGRVFSTETQIFLNESNDGIRNGASNLYQRTAIAPSGEFQSEFHGYNFFAEKPNMNEAWNEFGHTVLAAVGVVDPFGVADGINTVWYLLEGDYTNAGISAAGLIPYAGDALKLAKVAVKGKNAVKAASAAKKCGCGSPLALKQTFKKGLTSAAAGAIAGGVIGGSIGGGVGYYQTGTWAGAQDGLRRGAAQGALYGAAGGMARGLMKARLSQACFVAGTPVLVPIDVPILDPAGTYVEHLAVAPHLLNSDDYKSKAFFAVVVGISGWSVGQAILIGQKIRQTNKRNATHNTTWKPQRTIVLKSGLIIP